MKKPMDRWFGPKQFTPDGGWTASNGLVAVLRYREPTMWEVVVRFGFGTWLLAVLALTVGVIVAMDCRP